MAVKIYLGKPPAHVENWIKNHTESNLKHTFGVISDIHQIYDHMDEVNDPTNPFVTALNVFKSKNITDISMCGDVTDNGAGGNFDAFVAVHNRNYDDAKIESCTGNHDREGDSIGIDLLWSSTFDHGINFAELKNDKLFVYFSFGTGSNAATNSAPYAGEELEWLRTLLTETYPTKFAFIFMHFPFNSIYSENNKLVGIKADQDYGFGNQDGQCYYLFEMLRNRGNCMVFSGHTHYELGVQDTISNYANMDSFGNNMYCVHVPSLTKPRNDQHVNITSNKPCQGYIVDYTNDAVEIKAIDFLTGSEITKYNKTYNIKPYTKPDTPEGGDIPGCGDTPGCGDVPGCGQTDIQRTLWLRGDYAGNINLGRLDRLQNKLYLWIKPGQTITSSQSFDVWENNYSYREGYRVNSYTFPDFDENSDNWNIMFNESEDDVIPPPDGCGN